MIKNIYSADSLDWGECEKTASGIKSFKSRLPEDAARTLANEVLNRVTRRFMSNADLAKGFESPSDKDIDALAQALIASDLNAGKTLVANLYDVGVKVDNIYLDYLAAAAQRLGDWWDEDRLSFVEVTMGTSRIYSILRMLDKLSGHKPNMADKSAVFATVPGDTHTLGITMACDIFQRQGWDIELLIGLEHDDLIARIDKTDKVIIGVSAGGEHVLAKLAKLILAIRIHRPEVLILVSGAIVAEAGDILSSIEPDAVAEDIDNAMTIMEEFWQNQKQDQANIRH